MKKYFLGTLIFLIGAFLQGYAQNKSEFETFARTKDSLTHIAYFDRDMPMFLKHHNELLGKYNKLNPKDKETFAEYLNDEYYYLASLYALKKNKPNALKYLELSKQYDYDVLVNDTTFKNLAKEPKYIKYLTDAKNKLSKYQTILQKETFYDNKASSSFPAFTYQSSKDPNLIELHKTYHLDSISGSGEDILQIINLMHWVHSQIIHDGSKGNPDTKNAMSFLKECKNNNKTLNCRGLATVLNEIYLAKGFQTRLVTCLPKDTTDQDCHVITAVWGCSLQKWLWMDPTFNAYVLNEKGELLSIEEVRERLLQNKPLILNPDANRNLETSQTKADYLDFYMAKNLYKIECAASSEYNYETPLKGKDRVYVQLLPVKQLPPAKTYTNKESGTTRTTYFTNNSKEFWAAPPIKTLKITNKHSVADYENVLQQFKTCYNKNDINCLYNLSAKGIKSFWSENMVKELIKEYGQLQSIKFMDFDAEKNSRDDALFMVVFDKSVHCLGVSLDDNNKIANFRFQTTSPFIDWLLAKAIVRDREKK